MPGGILSEADKQRLQSAAETGDVSLFIETHDVILDAAQTQWNRNGSLTALAQVIGWAAVVRYFPPPAPSTPEA